VISTIFAWLPLPPERGLSTGCQGRIAQGARPELVLLEKYIDATIRNLELFGKIRFLGNVMDSFCKISANTLN
jgi:hypothetical protein